MWRKIQLPFALMIFATLGFSFWLAALWPGLFNHDTFVNLIDARAGVWNPWVSYVYSGYLIVLTTISLNPGFIGITQILIASGAAAAFTTWALNRSRWREPVLASFACLVLFPLNGVMNIFYTRDWLFSWLHCGLAVLFGCVLLRAYSQKQRPSLTALAMLMFLASLTALTRRDGLPLIFVLPCLLFVLARAFRWVVNWKDLAVIGPFLVAVLLGGHSWNSRLHGVYEMTAIINPLSHILRNNYTTLDREEDRRILDRVIDYQKLIELHHDFEIPAFHAGAVRKGFNEEDLGAVKQLYARMVWNNKSLFVANRLKMATGIMGRDATMYYTDDLGAFRADSEPMRKALNIAKNPISRGFNAWAISLLHGVFPSSLPIQYGLFTSAWLSLFLCLTIMICFKAYPISAAASLLIVCRLPIVFLAAPAAQFKYIYSLYLFSFFLIPLACVENSLRNSGSNWDNKQNGAYN